MNLKEKKSISANLSKKIVDSKLVHTLISSRYWRYIRLSILFPLDILAISFAYYLSFVLRFDNFNVEVHQASFFLTLNIILLVHLVVFYLGGMYKQIWKHANINSAILIIKLITLSTIMFVLIERFLLVKEQQIPRSIPLIYLVLATGFIGLIKFSWRSLVMLRFKFGARTLDRCFIFGAGGAGELFYRHCSTTTSFNYRVVGFIDDDKNKKNRTFCGLKVLGDRTQIKQLAEQYQVKTVIFAIANISGADMKAMVSACQEANLNTLIVPNLAETLSDNVINIRKVEIADLLGRTPKAIDKAVIRGFVENQIVLITGAGGSIGSEIARQVAKACPAKIILLDASEYNLYAIDLEIREKFSGIVAIPCLCSVLDVLNLERIFIDHKPTIVIHAAAYKHVPLVECNPIMGINNNILGTKNLIELSEKFDIKTFLQISTDKAVRPTNIMGATKRACELMIQSREQSNVKYIIVRFGNVLGSSGSVIPRFIEQIKLGGPVTVTHPDVTRYFMLTSEAVGLVLQSAALSKGGDIYVLDMGTPVKIAEMAEQLIKLTGKEPHKDIKIEFTGLRPGEKLYEELTLSDVEDSSLNDGVYIAKPMDIDKQKIANVISQILYYSEHNQKAEAISLLMDLAHMSETLNS